jgi:carboxyl-terminal processing protease
MPDIFVALDTSRYSFNINRLLLNNSLSNYVYDYYLEHRAQIDSYKGASEYNRDFRDDGLLWDQFVQYARKDSVYLQDIFTRDKKSLQHRLKALLARFRWRNSGFYQVLNSDDTVLRKALETLPR